MSVIHKMLRINSTAQPGKLSVNVDDIPPKTLEPEYTTEITRAALHRVARIGDLYDIRTESFLGQTLLNTNLGDANTEIVQLGNTTFQYVISDSTYDRCHAWGVEASLTLNIFDINFSASGSYVSSGKESSQDQRVSFVYKEKAVNQRGYFSRFTSHIDKSVLESKVNATHVVSAIDWGALVAITCEQKTSESEATNKANIAADFKYLLAATVDVKFNYDEDVKKKASKYAFKCASDVAIKDGPLPLNFADTMKFLQTLPHLMNEMNKDVEGKARGIPLTYYLIPLKEVAKMLRLNEAVFPKYNDIGIDDILTITQYMEKINAIKQRLFHLQHYAKKTTEELAKLSDCADKFAIEQVSFLKKYRTMLRSVKSTTNTSADLIALVEQAFKSSENTQKEIDDMQK